MSDVTGKASAEQQALALAASATATWQAAMATCSQTLTNIGGAPTGLALVANIQAAVTADMVNQLNAAAGVSTEMAAQTS